MGNDTNRPMGPGDAPPGVYVPLTLARIREAVGRHGPEAVFGGDAGPHEHWGEYLARLDDEAPASGEAAPPGRPS